jgi:hypothetical protein
LEAGNDETLADEGGCTVGFLASLLLLAGGAVLTFAVETESSNGWDVNAIGILLMVIGALGIIASVRFWNTWGGNLGAPRRPRITEEDDTPELLRDPFRH